MRFRSLKAIEISLFIVAPTPLLADTPPTPTVEQIDQQIAALQLQRTQALASEARAAIEAEKREKDEAAAATKRADDARNYLASIGEPVISEASSDGSVNPGTVTTITVEPDGTKTVEIKPYSQDGLRDDDDGKFKFGGLDFGIGVAFSHDIGSHDRVKEASVVD